MANVNLTPNGVYSVVDLELLSAEATKQVVAQDFELDATDFATEKLENGQVVVLDHKTVKNPAGATDRVYLHATETIIYDGISGKEAFAVTRGKGSLPRLFALNDTDVISTNACFYDDADFATLAALKTAIKNGEVYAVPSATRDWKLVKVAGITDAKVYGEVIDFVALSNERDGVRFRIVK